MRISDWSSDVCSSDLHRDIAAVLTQAGRFLVYKPVLVDMMARVPHASSSELTELLEDFKRMCCSAEYMFIFAEEALKRTEAALEDDSNFPQSDIDTNPRKRSLSEITDQMPTQSQSRSEKRRGGKEGVSTCRSRWAPLQ